jgi:L-ascorbate metabolism protein UlaG (beta-lactamase superfamily)
VITARGTRDLLRSTHFGEVSELRWQETKSFSTSVGTIEVMAFPVKHWGARVRKDTHRGFNGYLLERDNHRILFGGDTAFTDTFFDVRKHGPIDLAIMSIGCYNPWIRSHCTPEEAIQMANDAGARFIMPVHHQTFRLSFEPFREPIERFENALRNEPERIALREIGQTFALPL